VSRDLVWALVFLLAPFVAYFACAEQPAKTPDEKAALCKPLAEVESRFIAEATERCEAADADSADACPVRAALDAKYRPLREAAVRECYP
jgi:hypothetical protein